MVFVSYDVWILHKVDIKSIILKENEVLDDVVDIDFLVDSIDRVILGAGILF